MSTTIDLFAASPATLASVVADIERIFGKPMTEREPQVWAVVVEGGRITVRDDHGYDADRGMNLPRYPIEMEFTHTASGGDDGLLAAARRLFAALRKDGRYPLLLAQDLQHQLDVFEPPAAGRPPPDAPPRLTPPPDD